MQIQYNVYVIKQIVIMPQRVSTIELWMHLGGLLSTQEVRAGLNFVEGTRRGAVLAV